MEKFWYIVLTIKIGGKMELETPYSSGLTNGLLMFLHQEVWVSNSIKDELCRFTEKNI